jgi:hypothetical protein
MPLQDPWPGKALLKEAEVRRFFGFRDAREFKDFYEGEPEFPRLVQIGRTPSGEPRLRFRKHEILSYYDLLSPPKPAGGTKK